MRTPVGWIERDTERKTTMVASSFFLGGGGKKFPLKRHTHDSRFNPSFQNFCGPWCLFAAMTIGEYPFMSPQSGALRWSVARRQVSDPA